jgi:hypothetical protein
LFDFRRPDFRTFAASAVDSDDIPRDYADVVGLHRSTATDASKPQVAATEMSKWPLCAAAPSMLTRPHIGKLNDICLIVHDVLALWEIAKEKGAAHWRATPFLITA